MAIHTSPNPLLIDKLTPNQLIFCGLVAERLLNVKISVIVLINQANHQ
jgi:hypothetical protein